MIDINHPSFTRPAFHENRSLPNSRQLLVHLDLIHLLNSIPLSTKAIGVHPLISGLRRHTTTMRTYDRTVQKGGRWRRRRKERRKVKDRESGQGVEEHKGEWNQPSVRHSIGVKEEIRPIKFRSTCRRSWRKKRKWERWREREGGGGWGRSGCSRIRNQNQIALEKAIIEFNSGPFVLKMSIPREKI